MTCIVAVESPAGAYIGGDSFFGTPAYLETLDRPKIFASGPLVIAWAGSLRGAQLLQHGLDLRKIKRSEDPVDYLVRHFVPAALSLLSDGGALNGKSDGPLEHGNEMILILRGRVYVLQDDFSIYRPAPGYAAAGAGYQHAIGALCALRGAGTDPETCVLRALEVSGEHCPLVRGPYHVIGPL